MIRRRDDRGSLPLAMLLTIVAVGLSGMLAGSVNVQFVSTRYTATRSDALDAAQSGLQVGLGHVRAAAGDPSKLPCGPWSGAVTGASRQTYSVTLYYLTRVPPAGNTTWANANDLNCTGTYLTSGTPLYVMLSSVGTAVAGQPVRTVTATYALRTASRDNIAGGLIHVWSPVQPPNPDLCFSASSADPPVGDPLTVQVCDDSSDLQRFTYTTDNRLILVVTLKNTAMSAMCLEASSSDGMPVRFKQCANGVPQTFLFNATHNFEGLTGTGPSATCYNLTTPGVAGSPVLMQKASSDPPNVSPQDAACGSPYTTSRTFRPDPAVGIGGVIDAGQLTSFAQYSSCVSDDSGMADMQPCQYVTGNDVVDWNLNWTLPDPSVDASIFVTKTNNKKYCLVSPGTAAAGAYVTIVQCPNPVPASMTWHRSTSTGLYATSYRLESSYGVTAGNPPFCLAPIDPAASPPDPWLASGITRLVVAVCDGSNLQKWNAPAAVLETSLTDVTES